MIRTPSFDRNKGNSFWYSSIACIYNTSVFPSMFRLTYGNNSLIIAPNMKIQKVYMCLLRSFTYMLIALMDDRLVTA